MTNDTVKRMMQQRQHEFFSGLPNVDCPCDECTSKRAQDLVERIAERRAREDPHNDVSRLSPNYELWKYGKRRSF
jgi:hypothetical protein